MFYEKHMSLFGFFLVIIALFLPFLINMTTKNTCATYSDYFLVNYEGNCYYNPDVHLEVPQIIEKYTGNVKIYNVTTSDGYVLTMFRIVKENPIGVVLLQPPISTGSMAYLSDRSNSIGIEIWRKGYEVWLSNHRGASYSRKHVNLTESDPEFWNFSFHEIAVYDLDAQFEVIWKETKSQITYIGYSMAGTEALIYASLKPENAQKYVKNFVLIAPLVNLQHFSSPFRFLIYIMQPFEAYLRMMEFYTLDYARSILQYLTISPFISNFMTQIVMGWTPNEMDPILDPYIFAHHGRGIANKMIYHYGQILSSHFAMYDYGRTNNIEMYGSETPPLYPLQNINNEMHFIYGDNDLLATPLDIEILCKEHLPKDKVQGVIEIPNHNHIDFMFSKHRRHKTYRAIFKILDNIYLSD